MNILKQGKAFKNSLLCFLKKNPQQIYFSECIVFKISDPNSYTGTKNKFTLWLTVTNLHPQGLKHPGDVT